MEFTEEVQVAPGIYLSKPIKRTHTKKDQEEDDDLNYTERSSRTQINNRTSEGTKNDDNVINKIVSEDHPEVLFIRAKELKVSIHALLKSNQYMREYDPKDPVCIEAIAENLNVIDKQFKELKNIRTKLSNAAPHLLEDLDNTSSPGIQVVETIESVSSNENQNLMDTLEEENGGLFL